MENLPDIHGATALVKDTKELLQQVSVDLSEERSCWSISLTCSDLGGENYHDNHELYKRLFRAKQGDRPVKITIEFQEAEMDLTQAQMFPAGDSQGNYPDVLEGPVPEDAADAEWESANPTTVEDGEEVPNAEGVVVMGGRERRTYKINGEEHEYGVAGTDADQPEGVVSTEQAEKDGAPEEFTEPPTGRRRRTPRPVESSE